MADALNKSNDYFLNLVANPNFNVYDFLSIGLNADNTSFRSKEDYLKIDKVKNNPLFLDDKGNFSLLKFDAVYNVAAIGYKNLTEDTTRLYILDNATYFRDNIFVDPAKRSNKYETQITLINNPLLQSIGFEGANVVSAPTKSVREIAESQSIWDPKTLQYIESPNDRGFFENSIDPLIMALYDDDVDSQGRIRGEEGFDEKNIVHRKGEKKINPATGTYYYERLNGRSIVGKEVLSAWDTITVDGSTANKFDPFDNDDRDQSAASSIVKSVLKVAPLIIPGVRTYYAGIRVALSLALLAPKVVKAFVGTDNTTVNQLEAIGATLNTDMSDYAQGATPGTADVGNPHPWGLESMLRMGADVFTLLAELRFVFEYAPKLIKGDNFAVDLAKLKEFLKLQLELIKNKLIGDVSGEKFQKIISDYAKRYGIAPELTLAKLTGDAEALAKFGANIELAEKLKDYHEIGKNLSKIYMTGITVADTYNIAKLEGATDTEAAILSLVHTGFEWKVLSLGISEQMMPELRMDKTRLREAIKVFNGSVETQPGALAATEVKENWLRRTLDKAQKVFRGDYHVRVDGEGINKTRAVLGLSLSAALGEGTEEVVEEVALDTSKALGNLYYWLSGKDTRLSSFDYRDGEFHLGDTLNRYALNFIGGAIGGSLGNLHLTIKGVNSINKINENEALGIIIDMVRLGKKEELFKTADNITFGNKYLSVTKDPINVDGTMIYLLGDKTDNEDNTRRLLFKDYINGVDLVLNENKMTIDDDSLLQQLSTTDLKKYVKEFRAMQLAHSLVSLNFLLEFNQVAKDLVLNALDNLINETRFGDDSARSEASRKNSAEWLSYIAKQKELKELKDDLIKLRDSFFNGEKSKEFLKASLFEVSDFVSGPWVTTNFLQYVVNKVGNDNTKTLSDELWKKYKDEWDVIRKSDKYEDILKRFHVFEAVNKNFSEALQNFTKENFEMSENDANVIESIEKLFSNMDNTSEDVDPLSKMETVSLLKNPLDLLHIATLYEINLTNNALSNRSDIITMMSLLMRDSTLEENYKNDVNNKNIGNLNFRLRVIGVLPQTLDTARLELELKTNYDLDNTTEIGDRDYSLMDPRKEFVDLYNLSFNSTEGDHIASVIEDSIRLLKDPSKFTEDLKKQIVENLKLALQEINTNLNKLYHDTYNEAAKELFSNPEFLLRLKNEISKLHHIKYYTKETIIKEFLQPFKGKASDPKVVNEIIKQLNDVSNSPIEELLDLYVTTLLNLPNMHAKELLTRLRNIMRDSAIDLDDINGFLLSEQEEIALNNLLNVAKLLKTNVLAARTDAVDFGNLLGYNSLVNDIAGENLVTIKNDYALLILQDIDKVINTIEYYNSIYRASSESKLVELDKLANKINNGIVLMINLFHVNIPDSWEGVSEFKDSVLKTLDTLKDLKLDDTSVENLTKYEQAKIDILEAYGNLLRKNRDKDLKSVLDSVILLAVNTNDDKINNNFTQFDTRTLIWVSAAVDAMSAHAFYKLYKDTIDPNSLYIPNPGLELSVFVANAKLLNGKVFSRWIDAYNRSMTDWLKCNDQAEYDRKMGLIGDSAARLVKLWEVDTNPDMKELNDLYTDKFRGSAFHISNTNSILVEGVPGCGKSTGFLAKLLEMINKLPELKPLLKNVAVISALKTVALQILDSNQLTGKVYTVEEFFKEKFNNWTQKFDTKGLLDLSGMTIALDPVTYDSYDSNVSINESAEKPSLIIFDECTRMSELDNYWINKYQEQNNIHGIYTGDYQLICTMFSGKIDGKYLIFTLSKNKFSGIMKLGISMRVNNNLKELNLNILSYSLKEFMLNGYITKNLGYYENDDANSDSFGLYGDKIIDESLSLDGYKDSIQLMLNSLLDGEKITYILVSDDGSDTELSKFIQDLKLLNPDKIEILTAMSSLGTEGLYYILEYSSKYDESDKDNLEFYYKNLYTAISRAKQGSLIVYSGNDSNAVMSSSRYNSVIKTSLSKEAALRYTENKIKIFNNLKFNDSSKLVYYPLDGTEPAHEHKKPTKDPDEGGPETTDEDPLNNILNNGKRTRGIVKITNPLDLKELSMLFHTALSHELGLCFATSEYSTSNSNRLDISKLDKYLQNGFTINYDDITDESTSIGMMIKDGVFIQFMELSLFNKDAKKSYDGILDFAGLYNLNKNNFTDIVGGKKDPIKSIKITADNAELIYSYIESIYTIRNAALYSTSVSDFLDTFIASVNQTTLSSLDKNNLGVKTFYIHKKKSTSNNRLPNLQDSLIYDLFADTNNTEENGYYVVIYDKTTNSPIYATKMFDHTSPITMLNMDGFNQTINVLNVNIGGRSISGDATLFELFKGFKSDAVRSGESDLLAIVTALKNIKDIVLPNIKYGLSLDNAKKLELAINVYLNCQAAFKNDFGAVNLSTDLFFNSDIVNTGVLISTGEMGGTDTYARSGLSFDGNPRSLLSQLKIPGRIYTKVLIATTSLYYGNDANSPAVLAGKPFILVSDNPDVTPDNIFDTFINETKSKNGSKSVSVIYVNPPRSNLKEYLYNLSCVFKSSIADYNGVLNTDFGNFVTVFRMLDVLSQEDTLGKLSGFEDSWKIVQNFFKNLRLDSEYYDSSTGKWNINRILELQKEGKRIITTTGGEKHTIFENKTLKINGKTLEELFEITDVNGNKRSLGNKNSTVKSILQNIFLTNILLDNPKIIGATTTISLASGCFDADLNLDFNKVKVYYADMKSKASADSNFLMPTDDLIKKIVDNYNKKFDYINEKLKNSGLFSTSTDSEVGIYYRTAYNESGTTYDYVGLDGKSGQIIEAVQDELDFKLDYGYFDIDGKLISTARAMSDVTPILKAINDNFSLGIFGELEFDQYNTAANPGGTSTNLNVSDVINLTGVSDDIKTKISDLFKSKKYLKSDTDLCIMDICKILHDNNKNFVVLSKKIIRISDNQVGAVLEYTDKEVKYNHFTVNGSSLLVLVFSYKKGDAGSIILNISLIKNGEYLYVNYKNNIYTVKLDSNTFKISNIYNYNNVTKSFEEVNIADNLQIVDELNSFIYKETSKLNSDAITSYTESFTDFIVNNNLTTFNFANKKAEDFSKMFFVEGLLFGSDKMTELSFLDAKVINEFLFDFINNVMGNYDIDIDSLTCILDDYNPNDGTLEGKFKNDDLEEIYKLGYNIVLGRNIWDIIGTILNRSYFDDFYTRNQDIPKKDDRFDLIIDVLSKYNLC